jgi:putative peptidoglycan lipid II flippase
LGLAATQVNIFVNTLLATSQGTGAVSWLTYAFRLIYLPIGLFGVSIATVLLPTASRHAAIDDEAAIRTTVSRSLTLMLMLNIPATMGLVVLATPIVRLLFEHGRFLPDDTAATAAALKLYAVGLVGYSAARIISPVFYAIGQSRVPVAASLVSIAINIAVSVMLAKVMGFQGLALGTSIAAMANGAMLFLLLRHHLHGLEGRKIIVTTARIVVATAAMAVVVVGTEDLAAELAPGTTVLRQTARLGTSIICGLATLFVAAKALRISEFDETLDGLRQVRKLL